MDSSAPSKVRASGTRPSSPVKRYSCRVRARELGAFANPKGRPRRKNSAIGNVV